MRFKAGKQGVCGVGWEEGEALETNLGAFHEVVPFNKIDILTGAS